MDATPLKTTSKYILKHGIHQVLAKVVGLNRLFETDFSDKTSIYNQLDINDIGDVKLKLNQKLYFDNYAENKSNGSFILIDPKTNSTVGVGFIK